MSFSLAEATFDRIVAELGGKEWLETAINATYIGRGSEKLDLDLGLRMQYSVNGHGYVAVMFPSWRADEDTISYLNIRIYHLMEKKVSQTIEGHASTIEQVKSRFEEYAEVCLF